MKCVRSKRSRWNGTIGCSSITSSRTCIACGRSDRFFRGHRRMSCDVQADRQALLAVQAATRSEQHEQAAQLAEAALATGLEHPLLYNVAAFGREKAGRLHEAERLLRRSLQIAPNDLGSRNALGLCLLRLERPAEALPEFDLLLASHPQAPFLYASRGTA